MKRLLTLVTLALLALTASAVVTQSGVSAAPQRGATLRVSPDHGTQYQTFGFTAAGLAPGEVVQPWFLSPDGDEFDFHVLVVGDDGTCYMQVRPVDDFAGASFGVWEAHFATASGAEATVSFTVEPYTRDQPSG